ncbi:Na+ channel auxiliary subunit TipE [Salinibacillus kushneri]|uniref:Na+ channel auxiliary subunit TipE n=1 Tax=Salinibacillus kushneri TaxID=237682 RepID=A0A1I0G5D6_9BACI|nr:YrrS family protein [Salinibacillus kushneri]SET65965.1 Na+ channel auxiliary subunit TipE [Salinibacillus kushneri]
MPNSFFDDDSRVDRFSKRRKNTKLMNLLIVLAVLLSVFLAFTFIFNDDDEKADSDKSTNENQTESEVMDGEESGNDNSSNEEESGETVSGTEDSKQNNENQNTEEKDAEEATVSESDDPNVLQVIEKNWEPIGTEQDEPHKTTYERGTVDWEEMWSAAAYAAGLESDDYITWWVTNGGSPQKVETTISNKAETETYRVYLQWVKNEGWQPTKVKILKENDMKEKHFSDEESNEAEANSEGQ